MNAAEASREILWNIHSVTNQYVMYGLLGVSLLIAGIGVLRHVELIAAGRPSKLYEANFLRRLANFIEWVVLQKGVVRERLAGTAHTLIVIGFMVLLFATTMVFVEHDLGYQIYRGNFYLAVTLMSDVLGFGVLVGCAIAAHRRYLQRPDFVHNRAADAWMLAILALLIIQGFTLEGLRIHATNDPWAMYSPVGLLFSKLFWGLSPHAASVLHYAMWWFHTITVFGLIAYFPYSKYFHVLASAANLYLVDRERAKGALQSPGDIAALVESGEEFSVGLGTIKDYTWKNLLDLEACTSCGRCQDACPAYNSGKPLSPKWMILDSRNHALALHAKGEFTQDGYLPTAAAQFDATLYQSVVLPSFGLHDKGDRLAYDDGFRAANKLVRQAPRAIGQSADHRIAGEVMDENVFWTCTTCMACVEACPVGINHVDIIVGNRRNMALMHGEIPQEAQSTLRALENRANPYGPPTDRTLWLGDIKVPILKAGDSVDYLYWVGCVSAYDARKQKIARSLVKLMKAANLSFGILGTAEGCSGDPARRLGEENLFQTLAKNNIELLKSVRFKTLVANCPHCFNTIKNEYPQFGNLGNGEAPEIIHHSVLLKKLLASGKLVIPEDDKDSTFTFHDPCYLGRYNDEYDAPRDSLRAVKGLKILEMDKSGEKALCCGAGGGHFWMDLKIGERVNVLRTEQAAKTGASHIATACPFCMQMLEDGVKLSNRESELVVKDIAEVLAEKL